MNHEHFLGPVMSALEDAIMKGKLYKLPDFRFYPSILPEYNGSGVIVLEDGGFSANPNITGNSIVVRDTSGYREVWDIIRGPAFNPSTDTMFLAILARGIAVSLCQSEFPTDPSEQFKLACKISNGDGFPPDQAEAMKWCRKAAEQGHAIAQAELGRVSFIGQGVRQDYHEAVKWYGRAANQGITEAQFGLVRCYLRGAGVDQDFTEAAKWCRVAACQGHVGAQSQLGAFYHEGIGVPQDWCEAVWWYRKAADQREPTAQYNLGLCVANGTGTPKDLIIAYMWLSIASKSDLVKVKAQESIEDLTQWMTREQVAEAKRLMASGSGFGVSPK